MVSPKAAIIVAGLGLGLWSLSRLGVVPTLLLFALSCLALSAVVSRYVPGFDSLNLVGTVLVVLIGLAMLPKAGLPAPVALAGGIFLLACTIAVLPSFDLSPVYAARGWVALVAAPLAVVSMAGVVKSVELFHLRSRVRGTFIGFFVFVSVLNIALGLKQSLFGMDAQEIHSAQSGVSTYLVGDQIRIMGAFQTNQDMGLFLACSAPALLVLSIGYRGAKARWLFLLTCLTYVVVFLSLTRTALVASVAAGLLALLFWGRGALIGRVFRYGLIAAALAGLVASILFLLDVPRVRDAVMRASSLLNLESDKSFNARLGTTLPLAWERFLSNPFGAGAGSAGPVSQQFPDIAPYGYVNADNGYLNIAIQIGFVGIIALVVILIVAIARLGLRGNPMANAAAATVTALAVAMFSAGYWNLLAPICLVGAFVGFGFASVKTPLVSTPSSLSKSARTNV
jgi:O-antigen ligase